MVDVLHLTIKGNYGPSIDPIHRSYFFYKEYFPDKELSYTYHIGNETQDNFTSYLSVEKDEY